MLLVQQRFCDIIVHELGDLTFRCSVTSHELIISGGLTVSDIEHEVAAHIIARTLARPVVWQDIVGRKRFIRPDDPFVWYVETLDPRQLACILGLASFTKA